RPQLRARATHRHHLRDLLVDLQRQPDHLALAGGRGPPAASRPDAGDVGAGATRRRIALALLLIAVALAWRPLLRPIGAGMILVGDIYSSALWDRNVAAWVTPVPRVTGTRETLGGIDMRVTWWRPGWGERHPGIMLVNGATALGNDDPETVRLAEALARAGYLVMLPEFPFIQEGRLEPRAPAIIDAAFARLQAVPEAREMPVGAFGFSVGGGMLLAAAGQDEGLRRAAYVGALGAYYDIDTYLASVVTRTQLVDVLAALWDPGA